MDREAAKIADDEFYRRHPELKKNGKRLAIDPSNAAQKAEWQTLYNNAKEAASIDLVWLPDLKYDTFREGKKKGTSVTSAKAHVFFSRATRLLVADRWPLAEYYVYIDTELSETIDFDPLGLLWTDEKGFPHFCDSQGNPTERVEFFPLSWANRKPEGTSCVLIFDTDLERLKQKRAALQGKNGANSNRRVQEIWVDDSGPDPVLQFYVPEDPDILPFTKILELAKQCDALIKSARDARQKIEAYIKVSEERAVMLFHRDAVNGWLATDGRRQHLNRVNEHTTLWDQSCRNFEHFFKELTDAYDAALKPLYEILNDEKKLELVFLCGHVLEGWEDPKGYHCLWSHQFFVEAVGMFAGTLHQQPVFEKFVHPYMLGLSANWGAKRSKCKCPTCGDIEQVTDPFAGAKPDPHFEKVRLKLKDLKLITSLGQRVVDMATKFASNFALILAMRSDFKKSDVAGIGFLGPNFFKRTGDVKAGFFARFADAWSDHVSEIRKRAVDYADHAKTLEDKRKALFKQSLKGTDPGKLGNALGVLGGAITITYFFTKGGKSAKDWVDFWKGTTDIGKGGVGLAKDQLAKKLVAKYGEAGAKQFVDKLGKTLGVAGAALQLGGAYLSLREAADAGDRRAMGWSAVQYMGADIYMTGVLVEFTPALGVSQVSGVVVAVIGAVVYLVGQVGEFVTRPGAEEAFLRSQYYYDDDDHRSPEEKERAFQEAEHFIDRRPHPGKI